MLFIISKTFGIFRRKLKIKLWFYTRISKFKVQKLLYALLTNVT